MYVKYMIYCFYSFYMCQHHRMAWYFRVCVTLRFLRSCIIFPIIVTGT